MGARTEVAADDAVPRGAVLGVKLLLDVCRHILLYRELVQRLRAGMGAAMGTEVRTARQVDCRRTAAPPPPIAPRGPTWIAVPVASCCMSSVMSEALTVAERSELDMVC